MQIIHQRSRSCLADLTTQGRGLNIQKVSFAVPAGSAENALTSREDGLLTTVLFRRVFISYADRFVVLDPW